MTVWLDKDRKKWRYDFQSNRERKTGYCIHPDTNRPAATQRDAEQIESVIRDRLRRNAPAAVAVTGFTLAEAVDFYAESHAKALASWPMIRPRLADILKWFGPSRDISTIAETDVAAYIAWQRGQELKFWTGGPAQKDEPTYRTNGRKRSIATINKHLKFLKAVLATRPARRYLIDPPEINLLKEPKRIPTPINQDMAADILKNSAQHLHHTIVLCIHTGMREREVLSVRTQQFNQAQRVIYLDETTKSRTGRAVYVNEVAFQTIRRCVEEGDALWAALTGDEARAKHYARKYGIRTRGDIPLILYTPPGKDSLPGPIKSIATAWTNARQRAGVKGGVRFHDTRASFCSYLAHMGVPTLDIQTLAGHEDIQTTMRYIKGADNRLMEAVDRLAIHSPFGIMSDKVPHQSPTRKAG